MFDVWVVIISFSVQLPWLLLPQHSSSEAWVTALHTESWEKGYHCYYCGYDYDDSVLLPPVGVEL
jgi:hypothetical protein